MIFKVCSTCGDRKHPDYFPHGGEACGVCLASSPAGKTKKKPARRRHWNKKAKTAASPAANGRESDRDLYRAVFGRDFQERR